jgi:hypothetical protein
MPENSLAGQRLSGACARFARWLPLAVVVLSHPASADDYNASFNDVARSARIETLGLFQALRSSENSADTSADPVLPAPGKDELRQYAIADSSLSELQKLAVDLQLGDKTAGAIASIKSQLETLQAGLPLKTVHDSTLNAVQDATAGAFDTIFRHADLPLWSPQRLAFPITIGQVAVWLVLTLIATFVAVSPPIIYYQRGYFLRRKQITNLFDAHTCQFYFRYYWASAPPSPRSKKKWQPEFGKIPDFIWKFDPENQKQALLLQGELIKIYDDYYGRRKYLVPIFSLICVVLFATIFVARSALYYCQIESPPLATWPPHILLSYVPLAALTGAYLWVAGDGLQRTRVNNYLPSDVYAHVLRIIVAIPMGFAVGYMVPSGGAPFIAFALGTFPLDAISRYIRILASKILHVKDDVDTDGDEVAALIGVNSDVAHRLKVEDVGTILSLAKCDPIRVMMRTNFDFSVVLDLMDQAIVACAISVSAKAPAGAEDKTPQSASKTSVPLMDILRLSGLGRASQIKRLLAADHDTIAPKLLAALPELTTLQAPQLDNLLRNIACDSKTELVCRLLSPEKSQAVPAGQPGSPTHPAALIPAKATASSLSEVSPETPTAPSNIPAASLTSTPPGTGTSEPPIAEVAAAIK